jgi:membrane dipeptidase
VKVLRAADAHRAKAEGKKGVILNFQNTTHFGEDLANVDLFYDFGLRIVQLTYNQHNLVGDGCTEPNPAGLSKFGRAVIERFNELGVLVDVSHCSEPTTLDAIEASEAPIAVTHAFCSSVFAHDRGKSDDVIRAIGETGGYFGILCVPFFITDDPSPNLDHFIAHLEHVVELVGPEHVGIGTDWGTELPPSLVEAMNEEMARFGFRAEHRVDWGATLGGYEKWQQWPNITRALVARSYSDEEIAGFLGGNFLRVFERVVG